MNRESHKALLRALTTDSPPPDDLAKLVELLQTCAREMHVDDLYKALDESDRLLKSCADSVRDALEKINYAALREVQNRARGM